MTKELKLPLEPFKAGLIGRLEKAENWDEIFNIFSDLAKGFELYKDKLGDEED